MQDAIARQGTVSIIRNWSVNATVLYCAQGEAPNPSNQTEVSASGSLAGSFDVGAGPGIMAG
jgi:hypothetical protein